MDYFEILKTLYPLHRTLVSADTDRAFGILNDLLLGELGPSRVLLHEFPSGSEASTWVIPKKYVLNDYLLLEKRSGGDRVLVDRKQISLSIAEYSQPVSKTMDWEELEPHLFYSERRPEAIPFVFKYFYRPNFGFCLPRVLYDTIDHRSRFHAEIQSEFADDSLKCLEVVLPGKTEDSILMMSNICHPFQVNDSITGVINNLMLIEHFKNRTCRYTLRFGFWPETIGAMAYFSRYRSEAPRFRWAIFTEMLGTPGRHALQFSRQETTLLDRIAESALRRRFGSDYRTGRYTTVLRNDERISNGINLDIPTISLSRYPYDEYHTSDDQPGILSPEKIHESFEVTREIVEALDRDVSPVDQDTYLVPGDVVGQPFLTRYRLFYDQTLGGSSANMNKIMEDVFSYSDGHMSLAEIARRFDYDLEDVKTCAQGLVDQGLFSGKKAP